MRQSAGRRGCVEHNPGGRQQRCGPCITVSRRQGRNWGVVVGSSAWVSYAPSASYQSAPVATLAPGGEELSSASSPDPLPRTGDRAVRRRKPSKMRPMN
eukprot:scaffold973_cov399-Prasinococcus_capsulatus_cf.AAC.19